MAAAVVWPPGAPPPAGLDDSKRLSAEARAALVPEIRARALAVAVEHASPAEVDRLNVLWASMEAMRRAVDALAAPDGRPLVPGAVLVDGNRAIPDAPWPQTPIVGGDARSVSIAAASVLAKVARDAAMEALDREHPAFGWAQNKGYPTAAHYAALAAHGPTVHHRRTFRLVR